jgi:hypothetical protein
MTKSQEELDRIFDEQSPTEVPHMYVILNDDWDTPIISWSYTRELERSDGSHCEILWWHDELRREVAESQGKL